MSFCLAYMTFIDKEEARVFAKEAIEAKVVACLNIFPAVESYFLWDNKLSHENEVVLIAKLLEDNFSALEQLTLAKHSYDNPCLLKLPIIGGSKKFLDWIGSEK